MTNRNNKTFNLTKIITRKVLVYESKIRLGDETKPLHKSGLITINSARLKDRIGEEIKVVIYGKKGTLREKCYLPTEDK